MNAQPAHSDEVGREAFYQAALGHWPARPEAYSRSRRKPTTVPLSQRPPVKGGDAVRVISAPTETA